MQKCILYFTAFVLFVCWCSTADCQYYFYNKDYYEPAITWETGVSAGGMNCLTDLGGRKGVGRKYIKDINWNATSPSGSLFVGANYKDLIGARLELAFGEVKASDNVLKNDRSAAYGRYIRNLNFRSGIRELSFSIKLNPFSILQHYNADALLINPYVLVGVGSFSFSPEIFYNNTWINVSDFHTEGQGFEEYPDRRAYKLTQFNIPVGMGCTYEASPVVSFHFEITYRKLWTDYLDDVSKQYIDPGLFYQYFTPAKAYLAAKLADRRLTNNSGLINIPGDIRGNEKNNDTYFSGLLKIAFIIGRQKRW